MPIIQVNFDVPDEIFKKLLTGEYTRSGGVIRHTNGGQIIRHLEDVNSNKDDSLSIGKRALQFALNNPILIKEGIKTGKTIVTGIYKKVKNNQCPYALVKFKENLKVYLNAMKEGSITIEIITDLITSLEELKMHSDIKKINISLSTEELDIIGSLMFEFTKKLAADNTVTLIDTEKLTPFQQDKSIINLQRYLEAQKRIFELAS